MTNRRALMRHDVNEGWWAQPRSCSTKYWGPDGLRYIIFRVASPAVKEFESILDVLISNGSARRDIEIVSISQRSRIRALEACQLENLSLRERRRHRPDTPNIYVIPHLGGH